MTTTTKTQIMTADEFAKLFLDMLSVSQSHSRHITTIGTHPDHGRLSFIQLDLATGDGVLTVLDPSARYERRPGELTSRERLDMEDALAA